MSSFIDMKEALTKKQPFVVYRKPNGTQLLSFFQNDDTLHITTDFSEKGFVFAPFSKQDSAILFPKEVSRFTREIWKPIDISKDSQWKEVSNAFEMSSQDKTQRKSKENHVELVKEAIISIQNGDLEKVVLSRKEVLHRPKNDVVLTFKKLLQKYTSAFVYIWYHPEIGLWMGATPETLVKIQEKRFSTMSLAGTQLYREGKNILWGDKELYEQQVVTNYILEKLKTVCEQVKAFDVETIQAGNLLHLQTRIEGQGFLNVSKLIEILHPTPAVCGYPSNDAKHFILKNEGYCRHYYTGFLGELNLDHSELYVNLRCMEVQNNTINVYVGGGITKDSDPEKEWIETVNKSSTMMSVV